jgi:hypothetical protein
MHLKCIVYQSAACRAEATVSHVPNRTLSILYHLHLFLSPRNVKQQPSILNLPCSNLRVHWPLDHTIPRLFLGAHSCRQDRHSGQPCRTCITCTSNSRQTARTVWQTTCTLNAERLARVGDRIEHAFRMPVTLWAPIAGPLPEAARPVVTVRSAGSESVLLRPRLQTHSWLWQREPS